MAKEFVGQEYMAATHGKGLHQESKGNRILTRLSIISSTVITLVSVFIVAFCVFFHLCPIMGTSMMTTLNATGEDTDSALTCSVGEAKHGDIIVMKLYIENSFDRYFLQAANGDQTALERIRTQYGKATYSQAEASAEVQRMQKNRYTESDSRGNYELIIKRLIGKPGDKISMRKVDDNFYLYLNGNKLDEAYLDPAVAQHDAANFLQMWHVLHTPETADLHNWVTTNCASLLDINQYRDDEGEGVPSKFMLTVPENHYFVMGDNRGSDINRFNKSWDSSSFGPLPTDNYYSYCVDVLSNQTSMPEYLWQKFVYYVCFGWAWQKWNPRLSFLVA